MPNVVTLLAVVAAIDAAMTTPYSCGARYRASRSGAEQADGSRTDARGQRPRGTADGALTQGRCCDDRRHCGLSSEPVRGTGALADRTNLVRQTAGRISGVQRWTARRRRVLAGSCSENVDGGQVRAHNRVSSKSIRVVVGANSCGLAATSCAGDRPSEYVGTALAQDRL